VCASLLLCWYFSGLCFGLVLSSAAVSATFFRWVLLDFLCLLFCSLLWCLFPKFLNCVGLSCCCSFDIAGSFLFVGYCSFLGVLLYVILGVSFCCRMCWFLVLYFGLVRF